MHYTIKCPRCLARLLYDDEDIVIEPWPHITCPKCSEWIALF